MHVFGSVLLFLLAFLVCFLPLISRWLDRAYGYIPLDAIVYTITAPKTNTPAYIYLDIAKTLLSGLLAGLLCFLALRYALRHTDSATVRLVLIGLFCLAALASFGYFWMHHGFGGLLNSLRTSDFIDKHYSVPKPDEISFPSGKPNVIYLMLESVEQEFNELPGQAPVLPELEAIRGRNLSFAGQKQVIGTSWTIGAQTAHFFGLPLKTPLFANIYDHGAKSFLPGASSIFDVLQAHGYRIATFMGSAANFAGTGLMMDSHAPGGEMHDYAVINKTVQGDPHCQGDWGLRDSCVYAYAKDELRRLAALDEPFFAIIATIDTHNEHRPLAGESVVYGDDRDNFARADKLAAEFLAWLEEQPFFADTIVVLLGDHEYMSIRLGPNDLRKLERTPYNALVNARQQAADGNTRRFSALDWAPTMLAAMGAQWGDARFGLGVSLFSGQPTLLEQYGFETVDREVGRRSRLYKSFF